MFDPPQLLAHWVFHSVSTDDGSSIRM